MSGRMDAIRRKMEALVRPYRGELDADVEVKCAVLDNDVDPNVMEQGGDAVEDVWMDDDEGEDADAEDVDMEGDDESDNEDDEEEE
eukprot:scaffold8668_cov89-Skeletonema_dohrnii-CCMP3373.AAC.5